MKFTVDHERAVKDAPTSAGLPGILILPEQHCLAS